MTPKRSDFGSTFVQKLMKFFLYFQWSSNFYYLQETCLKYPGIFSCTFLTRLDFHLRHSTQECRQKLRKTGLKGGWSQMRQFYSFWVTLSSSPVTRQAESLSSRKKFCLVLKNNCFPGCLVSILCSKHK